MPQLDFNITFTSFFYLIIFFIIFYIFFDFYFFNIILKKKKIENFFVEYLTKISKNSLNSEINNLKTNKKIFKEIIKISL